MKWKLVQLWKKPYPGLFIDRLVERRGILSNNRITNVFMERVNSQAQRRDPDSVGDPINVKWVFLNFEER